MGLRYEKPSDDLYRELKEVASKAEDLNEYLFNANILPEKFPSELILSLCMSLTNLQHGTAEGCREPLVYARKRLPALRREYIGSSIQTDSQTKNMGQPLVERGELLDRKLSELAFAVVTAIDQYQHESNETIPEGLETEKPVDLKRSASAIKIIENSKSLDQNLSETRQIFNEIREPSSKSAENLERQILDLQTNNRVVCAELAMPNPRPNWMRPIAYTLIKLPSVLRKTGQSLKVGIDIASPFVHRWNSFWSNLTEFALEEVKSTGDTIIEFADQIEISNNFELHNKTSNNNSKKRGENFVPQSSPLNTFEVLQKLASLNKLDFSYDYLTREFGRNELRTLSVLGYIRKEVDRAVLLQTVKEYSEISFKNKAANLSTIKFARNIISLNPNVSYLEVANAVADEFGKKWSSHGSMQRNGHELIRWVIWLEPYLLDPESSSDAYSMVSRALGEQKPLGGRRKIFGEKKRRLEELIEQGVSYKEIAVELDLAVGSIYNWKAKKRRENEKNNTPS